MTEGAGHLLGSLQRLPGGLNTSAEGGLPGDIALCQHLQALLQLGCTHGLGLHLLSHAVKVALQEPGKIMICISRRTDRATLLLMEESKAKLALAHSRAEQRK